MTLSLLRSPKYPDPEADMGVHEFAYAVMPHIGGWREAGVVAEAHRFNAPVLWAAGGREGSLASCDDPNLVLDTVKLAEDDDGTVVVRLYECHGARGVATLLFGWKIASAVFCNILEDESGEAAVSVDGRVEVPYTPFQIVSLKLRGS